MKPTRPNRWTIVIGATAVAGITAGTLVAASDDGLRLNDPNPAIQLNETTTTTTTSTTTTTEVDAPPETTEFPALGIDHSVSSPFDSPNDSPPSPVSVASPPSPVSVDSLDSVDSE